MVKLKDISLTSTFNRYIALAIVGEGGTGVVYRVEDEDGNTFAAKCLRPSAITRVRMKRFKNELSFCENPPHANIVRVLDHGLAQIGPESAPFYVMPLYPNTLRGLMKGDLSQDLPLEIFSKLLDGIEAAHMKGIWHRDIKPENVLLDEHADMVVVADFGIAHFAEEELYTAVETSSHERLANFQYAAPEQRIRGRKVDNRTDIYALGLILNEMYTGELAQGTGFKLIASSYPRLEYLDEVVDRMIRQLPDDRPRTIEEVKAILRQRESEFFSRQKLSDLRNRVIPHSEVDDPLVSDPVRLVGADYGDGNLILTLSQPVNPTWVSCFKGIGTYTGILGKGPPYWSFSGDKASIPASERDAQGIVNSFKSYLDLANRDYRQKLEADLRKEEERNRRLIAQQIAKEEERRRVLDNLDI
jgi:serine/threonine protein kinase